MTFGTMQIIQTVTVPAGGQGAIEFLNIPQTYDDLKIVMSARSTGTNPNAQGFCYFAFNGSTSDFSSRRLIQDGTSLSLDTGGRFAAFIPNNSATASTFGSMDFYLTDYRSANNKEYSVDQGMENNSASAYLQGMQAGVWSNSAAITSITIGSVIDSTGASANFAQHSTATLYGITRIPAGAKATGGVIYDDSSFWYHVFTSSGTFTPSQNLTCDYLVVAGGGGGGCGIGGGGGAGGYLTASGTSTISGTNYAVTVGAGGNGSTSAAAASSDGSNSSVFSIVATGGGGSTGQSVGFPSGPGGRPGGSGGGGARNNTNGGAGTAGQGFNGGSGSNDASAFGGGAGGGASAVGGNGSGSAGGTGGAGRNTNSSWATATNTGVSGFYAGGGGGGVSGTPALATGGSGGGGNGGNTNTAGSNGVAFTGSGGGGGGENSTAGQNGGNGGSGIVIVRYAK